MIDKRLLPEVKRHGLRLTVLVGLGMAGGVLAVLQAGLITKIVNGVFLESLELAAIKNWLLFLLFVMAARAGNVYIIGVYAHDLAERVKTDLRSRLVKQVLAAGPIQTAGIPAGEVASTIVQGVENIEGYFSRYIPQLAGAVLIPIIVLIVAVPLDYTAAIIMCVTAPLIPLFMTLIGQQAKRRNKQQWEKLSYLSAHFLDVMRGLTTLKLFGRSREQAKVIARMSNEFRDTTLSVLKIAFLSSLVLELFSTISIALIAVSVGLRLLYGQMDFINAFFLLLLAPEFYLPLRQLGTHFHTGMAGAAAADSIYRLLILAPEKHYEVGKPFSEENINICFQNVYAAYDNGKTPALTGLSFEIKSGSKMALVGPSGAGKSTVINLLIMFIKPEHGQITINGMPLNDIDRNDWLSHIAYVPQMPHIFYGTVADNIRMGSEVAPDKIKEAAKAAGAHDFIAALPSGYETVIGEGGHCLSGGERQRIALARAFLREPRFLILDEATASLDAHSEEVIQQAVKKLMHGRTVLVVAHRLTTVIDADKILVLDKGRKVEYGNHTELLAQKGLYSKMVSAFASEV